ncbi:protein spitz-like [Phlebotomus argentipes]|uniref:protein spitz-like n=1 Tax=Phlebotomus argentipes TaxID=94469 RepID=UPI0028932063|nr:protein spitz-like [Phlebotomus argentipes]
MYLLVSEFDVKQMERIFFFMVVLSAVFPVADGCSSRHRRPMPVPEFNACSAPYSTAYCLNGGACFNYTIGQLHLPACQCAPGFMGERCELKYLRHRLAATRGAALVGLAALAVALLRSAISRAYR